jgi:hypothetical protein
MALALGKLTTRTPKFRGSGFVGMHVKPITAQEKFNFPRANAILARAPGLPVWLFLSQITRIWLIFKWFGLEKFRLAYNLFWLIFWLFSLKVGNFTI